MLFDLAVGRRYRTYEKNVVLEISRKLKKVLNKQEGYRAFLTRDGDYYVSFNKRLKIAREYGADLFISIHADAFKRKDARGSSVYCLSVKGASSEAAKLLASRENLSDIIGGSSNGENGDEWDPIILNMFQTNSMNASKIFGSNVLKHLDKVGHVKFSKVQEASFRVLKLPSIPSVLVETAYITNPSEESLLRNSKHQAKIANAVASSITEFLPVHSDIAPKRSVTKRGVDKEEKIKEKTKKNENVDKEPEVTGKQRISSYMVVKGDTIPKIAKKHGMTSASLLKLNGMKLEDPLFADQKLKVTEIEKESDTASKQRKSRKEIIVDNTEPDSKPTTTVYKVKNGDTLDKIAQKYNTKLSVLLKLNHMKLEDPLFVGQKLKVPEIEKDSETASKQVKPKKEVIEDNSRLDSRQTVTVYKVKKGDTLDKIAQKFDIKLSVLLKLNHMEMEAPLLAGQKLKIVEVKTNDEKEKKESEKQAVTFMYKVKRGDTLEKIANKYKTSITELRKLNGMKQTDVLLFDQKLKISRNPS